MAAFGVLGLMWAARTEADLKESFSAFALEAAIGVPFILLLLILTASVVLSLVALLFRLFWIP